MVSEAAPTDGEMETWFSFHSAEAGGRCDPSAAAAPLGSVSAAGFPQEGSSC